MGSSDNVWDLVIMCGIEYWCMDSTNNVCDLESLDGIESSCLESSIDMWNQGPRWPDGPGGFGKSDVPDGPGGSAARKSLPRPYTLGHASEPNIC